MVPGHRSDQHVRPLCTLCNILFCSFGSGIFAHLDSRRLYHCNPWVDTVKDGCSSFDQYLLNPTNFFMRRFSGMTLPVANFLVDNVFCILDDPTDDSQRIGAREFGVWVPVLNGDGSDGATLPALDLVLDEEDEEEQQQPQDPQQEEVRSPSPSVRSNSNTKRRKRGRKGKGMNPSMDHIQTSELLASASQTLARELSRQTRSASATLQSFPDVPPPPPVPAPVSIPIITKKPSRWKLSYFAKNSGEAAMSTRSSDSQSSHPTSNQGPTRTTRVTNLIMGLDSSSTPTSPPLPSLPPSESESAQAMGEEPQLQPQSWRAPSPTSMRSGRASSSISSSSASNNWRSSMASTNTLSSTFTRYSNQSRASVSTFATSVSASSASSSTNWRKQSGSAMASTSSLASSLNSNNGSQSSHINGLPRRPPANIKRMFFSADAPLLPGIHSLNGRFSALNGVPWELSGAPRHFGSPPPARERKRAARGGGKGKQPTTGTTGKSALEPINERPQHQMQMQCRQDAATSTTDLSFQVQGSQTGAGGQGQPLHGQGQGGQQDGEAPKVGKAQINALAKMISALRR